MYPEVLPLKDMHPEVLQLIVDKLTDLARRELGYPIRFEWPKEPQQIGRKVTVVVVTDRPLNQDERKNLEVWCHRNLGSEWPTLWDHLLKED